MQNRVLVLSNNKEALMPCHPARARELLDEGKAAVYRRFPFTIILKERDSGEAQPVQVKIDPGSKVTGIVLVGDFKRGKRCIWVSELTHRGAHITKGLEQRRGVRRSRRNRKTRYRKARYSNRTKPKGWLAPSLLSRVHNITHWVKKLSFVVPITSISMELVSFDFQKMENPEIRGIEYQQGELQGYEVKEYLLEKWGRTCAYCDAKETPLQVEHIQPRARGGSDRISNLTLACASCNQNKGSMDVADFLKGQPKRLEKVLGDAKKPLRDAAAVNSTRWSLHEELKGFGLTVECGSGGRTKYNRKKQGYPKEHWLDALCVGISGADVFVEECHEVLEIRAMGRGSRQKCRVDKYGFPRTKAKQAKRVKGFGTGDMVKAVVLKGKKKGSYVGRVAIRETGSFNIKTKAGTVQGISYKDCELLQRSDGYGYTLRKDSDSSPA